LLYAGVAALAAGAGYYFYNQGNNADKVKNAASDAEAAAKGLVGKNQPGSQGKPAFTGGDQGWISLKLDSVENINHNTKKLRFALPESDDVSGLKIASALLTKYKGPEMQKPAIRPYTPISDESKYLLCRH
jgi:cytochrome-b5 reductase